MHQLRWTAASIVSKIFDPMRTAAAKGDEPSIDVSELLGDLTKNGFPPDEVAASLNALSTTTESDKLSEVLSILLDTASSYANGNNSEIVSTFFASWRQLDGDEREERLVDYFALVHDASNELLIGPSEFRQAADVCAASSGESLSPHLAAGSQTTGLTRSASVVEETEALLHRIELHFERSGLGVAVGPASQGVDCVADSDDPGSFNPLPCWRSISRRKEYSYDGRSGLTSRVVTETEDRSLSEARVTTSSQEADILYVSPAVTNCQSMGGVLRGVAGEAGRKKPKVILATVNPLIPPPVDIRPQPPSIQQGANPFSETSDPSVFLNAQCSVSGQDSVMASRGYSLLKMRGAYVWYVREDIYRSLFQPRNSQNSSPASLHAAWLVGWFCNPLSRYTYDGFMHQSCILGLDSYASLSSGGSEVAPINTAFCDYLSSRGVAVEVGCEGTNLPGAAADEDEGLVDREAQSGHLLRGKRGWGNDKHTHSSEVDSAQECASYCASLKGCQFWTFDDTAMYGAQMCWAWTEGYPDEVRDEGNGWASMNWTDFTASAHSGREKAHLLDSPDPSPWAYFPMREMIGQRYALTSSGRGRCVDTSGECECFPPYRGLYCSVVDRGLGLDQERPYRGVLHYLTSNLTSDVSDLNHSLP
ncbi:hypothetical protein FOZ63_026579, partial [Perkinsus olseni]